MGVKHGNQADAQVEKSGSLPSILGVRKPGLPLILYTDCNAWYILPSAMVIRAGAIFVLSKIQLWPCIAVKIGLIQQSYEGSMYGLNDNDDNLLFKINCCKMYYCMFTALVFFLLLLFKNKPPILTFTTSLTYSKIIVITGV